MTRGEKAPQLSNGGFMLAFPKILREAAPIKHLVNTTLLCMYGGEGRVSDGAPVKQVWVWRRFCLGHLTQSSTPAPSFFSATS